MVGRLHCHRCLGESLSTAAPDGRRAGLTAASDFLLLPQHPHHHGPPGRARKTCDRCHAGGSTVYRRGTTVTGSGRPVGKDAKTDGWCLQTVYVHQMTWYISFTAILLTILILYVRIFPISWLRRACRASGYFSLVWMIVNIIVLTFQCTPVEYFWKHDRPGGGHCIHTNEYYAIACGVSMGMLILVFLLPLPIIRNLQITRHKKWGLAAAFTVGVL